MKPDTDYERMARQVDRFSYMLAEYFWDNHGKYNLPEIFVIRDLISRYAVIVQNGFAEARPIMTRRLSNRGTESYELQIEELEDK